MIGCIASMDILMVMGFHCIVEKNQLFIIIGSPCRLFAHHQACQREQVLQYTVKKIALFKQVISHMTAVKPISLVALLMQMMKLFFIIGVLVLGFKYAARQYIGKYWCSDSGYDKHGPATNCDCDGQNVGGWRN